VRARYAIFATQVREVPKILQDFARQSPDQAALMSGLKYAHYSVHVLFTEGHPFRSSYDTWVRAKDYTDNDFTDFILGRWMDPKIKGYENMRSFDKATPDQDGIVTIYHPLPEKWLHTGYTVADATSIARGAADRLVSQLAQLPPTLAQPVHIKRIETSRWPYAVHIPEPGHYLEKARILRRAFGPVFFANNNLGTPAFEEALFRGHCAADNVLKRIRPGFSFEEWSRCPPEN
jgi:hypothetical protein